MPAYRALTGAVYLGNPVPDTIPLRLPCGGCIGCRTSQAKAWALRCTLELQQHDAAAFTTLTYDDKNLPGTLSKRDLQLFLKRARKNLSNNRRIRFFACGEYGEQNGRPHYHALLYGLSDRDRDYVHDMWGKGLSYTVNATPATIAYTAGYTAKKINWQQDTRDRSTVDPDTGVVTHRHQPPFTQMSRRPGIGGHARQWVNSWRLFAVNNGKTMPVPRFLHQAWKDQATPSELESLFYEKQLLASKRDSSEPRLKAAELIQISKQSLQSKRRKI